MKKAIFVVVLGLIAAVGLYWYRGGFEHKPNLPTPIPHSTTPTPSATPTGMLPAEYNLAVPFTTQAPKVNWDSDHEEFCEEASVLMAAAYVQNFAISNPDTADKKLYEIKDFEMQQFGYFKDTTAAETSQILTKHFGISNVMLVNNPTLDQIRQAIANGKVIVAPFAGRQLGNPNFTGAGPLYHMLVIKGYTKDGQIITNDPGTRKGADYIYSPDVIMNAMHDWNSGDVDHGAKVIIVVG